jgi:hypothetical protein
MTEDGEGCGLREQNVNTAQNDTPMSFEIPEFSSAAKSKTQDRFIPHRHNQLESSNYEAKHLIFTPDKLGSISSPYELGSANFTGVNNPNLISDRSDSSQQAQTNSSSDS